jgi:hypothetical protein
MDIQASLQSFSTQPLLKAARSLFKDTLNIPLSPLADSPITPDRFFRDNLKDAHAPIQSIYLVGRVENRTFGEQLPPDDFETIEKSLKTDYEGLFILAVDLGENHVTRSELSSLTRDFNRAFKAAPVIVVYKYDHDQTCISLASCERSAYQQQWRDGEKPGKVSLLKDIMPGQPHAAHLRFLLQLTVPERGTTRPTNFRDLHRYWQRVFDNRVLNDQFYKEVSAWYQHAIGCIRLPDCPSHFRDNSEAHVKDFTVRLICRLMFCWFLKERGLIPTALATTGGAPILWLGIPRRPISTLSCSARAVPTTVPFSKTFSSTRFTNPSLPVSAKPPSGIARRSFTLTLINPPLIACLTLMPRYLKRMTAIT